jgi:GNAT superfamily N-acetyltransferase
VEPATLDDVPALSELLSVLFTQEPEFTPNLTAQDRGLREIIGNPSIGTVLLARDAHHVVGMVNLLWTVSTALGGRVAVLEDMVVAPSRRGAGIGTVILAGAIAWAREHGCLRITLLTDASNVSAHAFYTRQGFVRSSMLPMRLLL